MKKIRWVAAISVSLSLGVSAQEADPEIVRHIDSVKGIDNHAHVMAFDHRADKGYDQLRCAELATSPSSFLREILRFGPAQQAAVRTLYGYEMTDDREPSIKKLQDTAAAMRQKNGDAHYAWVLQEAGIQTVLANRTAMAPELKLPQFRWVPYADALLFPLDNGAREKVNPDRATLFTMAEALQRTYLHDLGMSGIPATLD
jgi:uncharacterized protein